MGRRGVAIIFLLIVLLLSPSVFAQVPAHKQFSTAEEDYFALVSFLQDSKNACETVLTSSYDAHVTISFSPNITLFFDEEKQQKSLLLALTLKKNLQYPLTVLETIDDSVESKAVLQDFIIPLRKISMCIIDLAINHSLVIDGFHVLHEFTRSTKVDNEKMIANFTLIHKKLSMMNNQLTRIQQRLPELSMYFSMDDMETLIDEFFVLITEYERYLDQFLSFLFLDEPTLVLYSEKNKYYLTEDVTFFGYFIDPSGFITNHSLSILLDDIVVNNTKTNDVGRFNTVFETRSIPVGTYSFVAETDYQGIRYSSQEVLIILSLMPTQLSLRSLKQHAQPNEKIRITGELTTIKDEPVQGTVHLFIRNHSISVQTNATGFFSITETNYSTYGAHKINASFQSTQIFDSCFQSITFFINEPTVLSLSATPKELTSEEPIILSGVLLDREREKGIPEKTISLFVNGIKTQQTTTDEHGNYSFVFSSKNSSATVFSFQTRFDSIDDQWRSSVSPLVQIPFVQLSFLSSFFKEYREEILVFFFLIISLVLIISIFYIYRNRSIGYSVPQIDNKTQDRIIAETSEKKTPLTSSLDSLNVNETDSLPCRQRIITRYQQLLSFFINHGMQLPFSYTHKDIQDKLETVHLSSTVIADVTSCFERAQYSIQVITDEEVQQFTTNMTLLQTEYLEGEKK